MPTPAKRRRQNWTTKGPKPVPGLPVWVAASPTEFRQQGVAWHKHWISALEGDAVVVLDLMGLVCVDGHADFKSARDWMTEMLDVAAGWPLRRVPDVDVLTEVQVRQVLLREIGGGQGASWARKHGIHKSLLTQLRNGSGRPGGKVLEALGILRLEGTEIYVRRQPWMKGWKSDYRGGAGGTKGIEDSKFVGFVSDIYDDLEANGELTDEELA